MKEKSRNAETERSVETVAMWLVALLVMSTGAVAAREYSYTILLLVNHKNVGKTQETKIRAQNKT